MVSLSADEKLGLMIVAMIRNKDLDAFKCSMCSKEMMGHRNCEMKASEKSVYFHKDLGELHACPIRMVPENIMSFIDQYDYLEKYTSAAPSYNDVVPRFWESVKFYDNYKYKLALNKKDDKKSPEDNMSKMAGLFKK